LLLLLVLTLAKFLATIISYSSGTAGGLFAPALFIGAMLGGSVAGLVNHIPGLTIQAPGAFALVGMGAVFVGIIRTPLTSILIIFEMTNDYAIILPLMLANMTSYAIARFLEPENVYEAILSLNKVHLPSPQDQVLLEDITAGEVMTRHPLTVRPEVPISEVSALFARSSVQGILVSTEDHQLLGLVTRNDVRVALTNNHQADPVRSLLGNTQPLYAHTDHTLNSIMKQLGEHEMTLMPIVSHGHPPRLLGVVTMSDILRAFAHSKTQQ
jgi:CIC family chloride channel protein